MSIRKFAIVGLTIGLVAIIAAVVGPFDDSDAAIPLPTEFDAGRFLDPESGIGSHEQIVEYFTQRVAERPTDYISATQLSAALYAQARHDGDHRLYESAAEAARAALAINPDDVGARLRLADALQAQHDFDGALAIGLEVLADEPTSIEAQYTIGDAYFELGDHERAGIEYERLEAVERNAAVVARLARLASATGDSRRAVELSEEALARSTAFSLRPHGRAYYHFQLGHHLFKEGNVDAALAALADAFDIAPDHLGTIEELATVNAAIGRPDDVVALYEQLASEEQRHLAEFLSTRDPELAARLTDVTG